MIDYLRLALATGVVLLPGAIVTRALGRRSWAESVAWALASLFAGLALAFALSAPFEAALGVHFAVGLAALPFAWRRRVERGITGRVGALAVGLVFGIALWFVSGQPAGDGLFHLARARKLLAFDDLSLGGVSEFADGGLHPGYAFPLWHGFLAAVAWIARADPSLVIRHEASILAVVAVVVLYEAGSALFRSLWAAGAVVLGQLSISSLASSNGGAFASLALPATASRLVLVPAALALLFERRYAAAAAIGLGLTVVHPTYTLFLALPLLGFVAVRALADRDDALRTGGALAAFLVPAAGVLLWLLPTVRETASYRPDEPELARALAQYGDQLEQVSDTAYRLAPEVLARSGSVAVAALFLVPLAGFAFRRRWAAFVLGGSVAVLVAMLVPDLFTRLSDLVSLSQSRRAAGFLPFAFAFAGGLAVLARLTGPLVPALGLAAGIALQLATPGHFGRGLGEGTGPGWLAWYALAGGVGALVAGALLRPALDRRGPLVALAALLFVLPVTANAAGSWSTAEHRRVQALTPGLIEALQEDVHAGAIVFSDLETSYRIGAYAPVYVAANPPAHVADTEANRPYARRRDVLRFLRTGDLAIPRRYGAELLVVDTARFDLDLDLAVLYRDERYVLYRL